MTSKGVTWSSNVDQPGGGTMRHRRPGGGGGGGGGGGVASNDGWVAAFEDDRDPISQIVNGWSTSDVADWLTELGHAAYAQNFVDNGVDGAMLAYITEHNLEGSMGVNHLAHRVQIMQSIGRDVSPHSHQTQKTRFYTTPNITVLYLST